VRESTEDQAGGRTGNDSNSHAGKRNTLG
jgi:hypothetical protein